MKFDFSQPTPQPKNFEEALKIISALWSCSAEWQKVKRTLTLKIADLEEKLNTNSTNSSTSPSSDVFNTKKSKKKYHGAGKNKALKQGTQKCIKEKDVSYYRPKKSITLWFVYQ
jgi:hypothetical protein